VTEPLTLIIAGVALGVALLAGWLSVPTPPDLDGERWFKVLLATLLRGAVEREGGDAVAWEERVLRFVPYHPAGRLPERKVADPAAWAPPGLSVEGEIGLVEALSRLDTVPARWERLYGDEISVEARLVDPRDLGEAYDPATWLGPGASWDDVADWGAGDSHAFADVLHRRLRAIWVLLEGPDRALPPVLPALGGLVGAQATRVPFVSAPVEEAVERLCATLEAAAPDPGDRLVIVGEAEAVPLALRALVRIPLVRDRMLAFVSVGGVVRGRPGDTGPLGEAAQEDWLGHWFTPEHLDTEVNRATPYLHLGWFDPACVPPGIPGLPVAATRLPPVEDGPLSRLLLVDLGVLPADPALPAEQVARGLLAVTALEVLTALG